jgi:hypothetical protein
VLEIRVRRAFGQRMDEIKECGENCIMRSFSNLCTSPCILVMFESRRMWSGHFVRMGDKTNAYRLLERTPGETSGKINT